MDTQFKKTDYSRFLDIINNKSDKLTEYFLLGYFVFGLLLASFYDTWIMGLGVGTLLLAAYAVSKTLFKNITIHPYVASTCFALYMAQFIYQMHGLFEMHFFAFFGAVLLITYQNWKVILPLAVTVAVHHTLFAYLQYMGYDEVRFTQLDYMDLQTFIFHVSIATGIIVACMYWANDFRRQTIENADNTLKLEKQLRRVEKNKDFALAIADKKMDYEFSCSKDDEMGIALENMRESLRNAAKKEAEEKFINQGMAGINDLLRKQDENVNAMSAALVNYLVQHANAQIGALYLAEEDNEGEEVLRMTGCYAYDRNKFIDKILAVGEGLVGETFLEKKSTHLNEIPDDYVSVQTGIGASKPRHIILIPLCVEDQPVGILEIASLHEMPQQVNLFLNKAAETIANAVQKIVDADKMRRLLYESRQNEEELRAQEEEMRQTNEELQATQEEFGRKEQEYIKKIEELEAKTVDV